MLERRFAMLVRLIFTLVHRCDYQAKAAILLSLARFPSRFGKHFYVPKIFVYYYSQKRAASQAIR